MLSILEDGAYVALDNHLVTTALQGIADVGACLGVGVVDIDIVHAAVERHSHQFERCSAVEFLEAAASDTDITHHQSCVAKLAVLHVGLNLLLLTASGENHRHRKND